MAKKSNISKGFLMEETLRNYFLKTGYYVVRGVPFIYRKYDITDIDIWLYGRSSTISREITIVDIKNKKTPQAIERIFWVKGLSEVLNANNAVVATTDTRPEVKEFGKQMGILVLNGHFLQRIQKSSNLNNNRLTEEDFISKIKDYHFEKLDGNWLKRIIESKSLLANGLSFDSCNHWLIHANFFAEQAILKPSQREIALRALYLISSYIIISIDYVSRELSFNDQSERYEQLKRGFTFGSSGFNNMQNILKIASGLIVEHVDHGDNVSKQLQASVNHHLDHLNTEILAEYFSSNDVCKMLFTIAKEFEVLAMNAEFTDHNTASHELKNTLYCLLDFWKINRAEFS